MKIQDIKDKSQIKVSEKEIGGEVRKVQVYCPTHAEWVEAIGEERLAGRLNQGLIAHDLATGLKAAFEESKKDSVNASRAETRKLVNDPDHVFDLRDFIAKERKEAEDHKAKAEAATKALDESLALMAKMMGVTVEELVANLEAAKKGE